MWCWAVFSFDSEWYYSDVLSEYLLLDKSFDGVYHAVSELIGFMTVSKPMVCWTSFNFRVEPVCHGVQVGYSGQNLTEVYRVVLDYVQL